MKIWIIQNQLGRRNLSAYDRSILALKLKPVIAAKAKEKQIESGGAVPQKSAKPPIETRAEIAKAAGVSHDTIAKVEKIEAQASPEIKAALRHFSTKADTRYKRGLRVDAAVDVFRESQKMVVAGTDFNLYALRFFKVRRNIWIYQHFPTFPLNLRGG